MNMSETGTALTVATSGGSAVTGIKTWDGSAQLITFDPTSNLAFSTTYVVTLAGGAGAGKAKDNAGNPLAGNYTFSFTTGAAPDTTPPTVSSSTPLNGATGELRGTNISVTFSEAMDKASAQTAFSIYNPSGYNAGVFTWSADGKTMTFNPDSTLPTGTYIYWRVNTAARDLAGNAMTADANRNFKTAVVATKYIYAVSTQDGYLYKPSGSNPIASTSGSYLYIGDSSTPYLYRSFITFYLGDLGATTLRVNKATLYMNRYSIENNPYSYATYLDIESVRYGSSLDYTDWDVATEEGCTSLGVSCLCFINSPCYLRWSLSSASSMSADVTTAVQGDFADRASISSRSQFRLRFNPDSDNDASSDRILLYSGNSVSPNDVYRPRLWVEYEYP
jgi:hypothetical protein